MKCVFKFSSLKAKASLGSLGMPCKPSRVLDKLDSTRARARLLMRRLGVRFFEIRIQLLFDVQISRQKTMFGCIIEFKLYLKPCLSESCMKLFFSRKIMIANY